jgi:hypothetical protein
LRKKKRSGTYRESVATPARLKNPSRVLRSDVARWLRSVDPSSRARDSALSRRIRSRESRAPTKQAAQTLRNVPVLTPLAIATADSVFGSFLALHARRAIPAQRLEIESEAH